MAVPVRIRGRADRRCPVSLALCAGAYLGRVAAVARRSVRRLPGPFAVAVAPVCTSHRISVPTSDGYSSRSSPVLRDVAGSMRAVAAKRQARRPTGATCRPSDPAFSVVESVSNRARSRRTRSRGARGIAETGRPSVTGRTARTSSRAGSGPDERVDTGCTVRRRVEALPDRSPRQAGERRECMLVVWIAGHVATVIFTA
jgi:hypothetical protein